MTKHIWESKPTLTKAERIRSAYLESRRRGHSLIQAATFAGYYCERSMQDSGRRLNGTVLSGMLDATQKRWQILKGANALNYRTTAKSHVDLMLVGYHDEAGMTSECPIEMVADWFEDQGRREGQEIRWLLELRNM